MPTPRRSALSTSLYGASKAAAEGYLSAYAEAGGADVTIFRFVSVMGRRYHVTSSRLRQRLAPTDPLAF